MKSKLFKAKKLAKESMIQSFKLSIENASLGFRKPQIIFQSVGRRKLKLAL